MAVEFELYNNKDEKLDAVNLGKVRRGHDTIYELKLKNAGTTTARNVVISAETLNNSSEVSEEEFNKQKNAKNWKSFSLKKNGVYTSSLNLGDIKAGYSHLIVEEAKILINDLYKETLDLLSNNKSSLDKLALLLLENETLHEEEINNFRNNI